MAVIVILAIIALIAVPIIINIVNESKEASNKRSVELYGKAISNAIARSQLNGTEIPTGDLSSDFLSTVQYTGSRVVCTTNKLYADGSVYLAGCKVGSDTKEYTYGTSQETNNNQESNNEQASTTRYYSWSSSGSISGGLPSDADTDLTNITIPNNHPFYLAFDSTDGETIDAAYLCFKRTSDGEQYCLQGTGATLDEDGEVVEASPYYTINQGKIAEAYNDVAETNACSFGDDYSDCDAGGLSASAYSDGSVTAYDGSARCYVSSGGSFECFES